MTQGATLLHKLFCTRAQALVQNTRTGYRSPWL